MRKLGLFWGLMDLLMHLCIIDETPILKTDKELGQVNIFLGLY